MNDDNTMPQDGAQQQDNGTQDAPVAPAPEAPAPDSMPAAPAGDDNMGEAKPDQAQA